MSSKTWKQYKINVPLPVEDRVQLTANERENLSIARKYKWMLVVDSTNGNRYQLQYPVGGDINTPISEWIWRVVDSTAILTSPLYISTKSLGISEGTLYPTNTPLETIIRDLLTQSRIPIAPTISLSTPPMVEKGSSGTVNISASFTLNDSNWTDSARYFYRVVGTGTWIELGSNVLSYTEISSNIEIKVTRDYSEATVEDNPELSQNLEAGTAESPIRTLVQGLPYFIGIGLSSQSGWDSVDSAFIQNMLDNFHSNSERLIKCLTSPLTTITIPYPYWTSDNASIPDPKYLWIAIPDSWGKVIESYAANNVDAGIMGSENTAWTGIEEIILSSPYVNIIWEDEPYKIYYTGYPTNAGYTPSQLFTFTLN